MLQKTRKSVESWIRAVKSDFVRRDMTEDMTAPLEKLFERARAGDIGEGYVGTFSPVIEEIRKEFKAKTGRVPPLDNIKGLQHSTQRLKYKFDQSKKPEVKQDFAALTATDYALNALALDGEKGGKPYWSTDIEKFARAFDAYVSDALEANGRMNSYLSLTGRDDTSVPLGQDRALITVAFSNLVKLIQGNELLFDAAMDPEQQAIFEQRVQNLAQLEKGAGAAYTFWNLAQDALRDADGVAGMVNWMAVEDAAIVQSVEGNAQAPSAVLAFLREHSPGVVTQAQQAALADRVNQVVASLDPHRSASPDASLSNGM
jgi:hypothetical protein